MKKPYPIKIIFVLIIIGSLCGFVLARTLKEHKRSTTGQPKQPSQGKTGLLYKLTVQDRKKYLVKIDQQKISRPHDTVYAKRKSKFFNVPVILYNFSNDTLRYLTMSCSWDDFFSINNQKLTIWSWPCDNNFPEDKVLLAHKSVTYNVPIVLTGNYVKGEKFSIGMSLFMINKQNRNFILNLPMSQYRTHNLIWSNEVEIL